MLVSLTVGKVDAGVAVLLTDDNRLIEFPSVLLPDNIASGSIVDITVSRNHAAEAASAAAFKTLQKRILNTYGVKTPAAPVLRLRNATQTSLVLEWDPIDLATASLRSLSLYRNGSKAGSIPRPLETRSTKISGLAIHTEYTFQLVLRTSAGTYTSEKLTCRTHKMTDLSGITVTAGILHPQQKEALAAALDRIGGKLIDTVRIDTTHFVCTEGRGPLWEKAVEMNIPVVKPEWVDACEAEGTIVGVRGYYLDADPKTRQLRPVQSSTQQQQHHPTGSTLSAAPTAGTTTTTTTPTTNNAAAPAEGRPSSQLVAAAAPEAQAESEREQERERDQSAAEPPVTPFPGGDPDRPMPPEPAPPTPPPKEDVREQQARPGEEAESEDRDDEVEQPSKEDTAREGADSVHNESNGPEHENGADMSQSNGSAHAKDKEGEGDMEEVSL